MGDPYAVLGLHRSATTDEVRAAFRRAALKFHPDRHVGEGPEAVSRASQQFNDVRRRASFSGLRSFTTPPKAVCADARCCVPAHRLSVRMSG